MLCTGHYIYISQNSNEESSSTYTRRKLYMQKYNIFQIMSSNISFRLNCCKCKHNIGQYGSITTPQTSVKC